MIVLFDNLSTFHIPYQFTFYIYKSLDLWISASQLPSQVTSDVKCRLGDSVHEASYRWHMWSKNFFLVEPCSRVWLQKWKWPISNGILKTNSGLDWNLFDTWEMVVYSWFKHLQFITLPYSLSINSEAKLYRIIYVLV